MTRQPYQPVTDNRRLVLDRKPCGRCGGSGHYSFNQIDGTRCYGCNGRGEVLTAQARKANEILQASRPTVVARDVIPGDRILIALGMDSRKRWADVEGAGPDKLNVGRTDLVFRNGEYRYGAFEDTEFVRAMTADERDAYFALAATLPGVTVTH